MSASYNITLVNLSADARTAEISLVTIDRPGLAPEELQVLLENFAALDAVQNVTADPEIRVQSRRERFPTSTRLPEPSSEPPSVSRPTAQELAFPPNAQTR